MNWKRNACVAASVALIVLIVGLMSYGQNPITEPPELAAPIEQARGFLAGLDVDVAASYDNLLKGSPLHARAGEVKKVTASTERLLKQKEKYGPLRENGIELVKTKRLGEDLALLRFLYKFENLPVVWYFTYYRTGGKWVVVGVRFDHEYELLAL